MEEVKIAEEEKDAAAAYGLFYKCFESSDARAMFDVTRKYDPTLTNENLFIIKDKGDVIAAARTVVRTLRIFNEGFDIGGIATTAVHPAYRGKGLFNVLTKFVLNKMIERDLGLCLVFARRAIDNIYVKHGFWGAPVERRFSLPDPPIFGKSGLSFREAQYRDIPFLEMAYRKVYGGLPVFLDRPGQLWQIKFNTPSFMQKHKCYICTQGKGGEPVGYAVVEDGKGVVEACATTGDDSIYPRMLFSKDSTLMKGAVQNLSLPLGHPAIKSLEGHPSSVFTRHPDFGGHVLKILDPYNFDSRIMRLLEVQLSKKGAAISADYGKAQQYQFSRVVTAALFGYEIPETKSVLEIRDAARWGRSKPVDFIFSSLDEF